MLVLIRQIPVMLPLIALAGCAAGHGPASSQAAPRQVAYSPFAGVSQADVQKIAKPSDLASMVESAGGPQQKFETDSAFDARMSKLRPFEVCKSISESSLKFDSSTGAAKYKEWLSDAQIAGYRDKHGDTFTDQNVYMPGIDISFSSEKAGQYTGQNSFGATAVVEIRKVDNIHLVFDPVYKKPLTFPSPYVEADARALVPKLKGSQLCVTAIPAAPFYRETVLQSSPTVANPYEGQITHRFFRIKIGGIRFADDKGSTIPGEISVSPGV